MMRSISLTLLAIAAACTVARPVASPSPAAGGVPEPRREMRAVWVATVANIDWPSRPGLPPDSQRAELIAIMDRAEVLHLNAVIFQVRPHGDALYRSQLEPWSEYLTGAQGANDPGWDPLETAVAEAHRRGMELHAWFNPYRASHPVAKSPNAATHISRTHPEVVRRYGRYLWMDPGEPLVQEHTLQVLLDVVRRYDIDGVHIDDYFYPYPERDSAGGGNLDFPDSASYARYRAAGGSLARDDWRRDNVNRLVQRLDREIHREKRWVKFGISPFGIWRPGNPPQITTSFDQYAMLYADARKWLREGWGDYHSPQLYWRIARTGQSYPVLLDWWVRENVRGRHLWPGNFTSRTFEGDPTPWPSDEVIGQIYVTRGNPGATGNVHFSMRAFALNRDSLSEKLVREAYRDRALPPPTPWLARGRPGRPEIAPVRDPSVVAAVSLRAGDGVAPLWWAVRASAGGRWTVDVIPAARGTWTPPAGTTEVAVSAVDRLGMEGPLAMLRLE